MGPQVQTSKRKDAGSPRELLYGREKGNTTGRLVLFSSGQKFWVRLHRRGNLWRVREKNKKSSKDRKGEGKESKFWSRAG